MRFVVVSLLLLAVIHSVMSGVRVKATIGGNASVHCSYERGSDSHQKYFIKGRRGHREELVRLTRNNIWTTSGRFSLEDDREKRELTVTIGNVSVEDAGLYWCGFGSMWKETLTEVNLDVVQGTTASSEHTILSTENAPVPLAKTAPHPFTRGQHEPADTPQPSMDEAGYLGAFLAAGVMACGIVIAIFVMIQKNDAQRTTALAHSEINAEAIRDTCVNDEIFPTNTSSSGDQNADTEAPGCAPPQVPRRHRPLPPQTAPEHPSSPPLLYSTVNLLRSSLVANDSSSFSGEQQIVYCTVQRHKDPGGSTYSHQMVL